jgi:DNA adenine methylase
MTEKLAHFKSGRVTKKFSAARIEQMDFIAFLSKHQPKRGDFIFVDPPYDSEFSNYGENNFGWKDQERLAKFLFATPANWMLIIKSTDLILKLYSDKGLKVRAYDKTYVWTIKERNVRGVVHLMITNY